MKLVFMGTPDFSVKALEALLEAGHEVLAVYSQPPRPAGRGQKERPSPVHEAALKHGLEVRTPKTLKDRETQEEFVALGADAAVVVAYGLLLPKPILDACPCFNIHASLLPRWRGAAPIQRAILAGDDKTGVTIMQMDEGMDTGDILLQEEIKITDTTTTGQLHDQLCDLGAKMIVESLEKLQNNDLHATKQPEEFTHAAKIKKEEAKMDWSKSAKEISCHIRGFAPRPGAYFLYNNEQIKILEATIDPAISGEGGRVVDNQLTIATKEGGIKPTLVQRQGKKAMATEELLRGFSIPEGSVLG